MYKKIKHFIQCMCKSNIITNEVTNIIESNTHQIWILEKILNFMK